MVTAGDIGGLESSDSSAYSLSSLSPSFSPFSSPQISPHTIEEDRFFSKSFKLSFLIYIFSQLPYEPFEEVDGFVEICQFLIILKIIFPLGTGKEGKQAL